MSAERIANPFHEGEVYIQNRAGEEDFARRNGAMLRNRVMEGALPFLEEQSMVVVGSEGGDGALWCSLLFGSQGFLHSKEGASLTIDLGRAVRNVSDPLWSNLRTHPRVGLLAIELATRRRIRINGDVTRFDPEAIEVRVTESYPNCQKYINPRTIGVIAECLTAEASNEGTDLDGERALTIQKADTLFIASAHPSRGIDASHRGGEPGFVTVLNPRTLRIPDYPGNSMFNTLGNLHLNAAAGLAVPDFKAKRVLQLTGRAEIVWDQLDRHLIFHIASWLDLPMPV